MGVVFLGEAADGRAVAVKVIQSSLSGDRVYLERFRREVAAAQKVRSRVTVAVLDADPDALTPWVAFEYVEGPNLQDVVEAAIPRLSASIGIMTGIAEALVAIHQVGIVHRDLKPSNVLCPPDGVRVIDFGIAAALEATSLTRGGLVGSPGWLAPEQITGEPLTTAVDVFAWGCVALYTSTGRLAFGGSENSTPALIYRVVNAEPDLTGVPEELIEPVSAALAKRAGDRPDINDVLRMMLPGRRVNPSPAAPARQWPAPDGGQTPAPPPPPTAALAGAPAPVGSPWAPGALSWPPPPSGPPQPAPAGYPTPSGPPPALPPQPPPPYYQTPISQPPAYQTPSGGPGWQSTAPVWGPPPPVTTPGSPPPKKKRLGLMIGIPAGVIAVIVVLAIIGATTGSSKSTTTTTVPATTLPATTVPAPATTAPPTPAGVVALSQLLPSDVTASNCTQDQSPPKGLIGLASALICSPAHLPGGQVFAFQFDNPTDYAASLTAFNTFKGFDPTNAGSTCPPGTNPQDSTGWHNNAFPAMDGQILECLSVGTTDSQPDYIWTYPTENAIMDAQAAAATSFTALDSWWTQDAPPP